MSQLEHTYDWEPQQKRIVRELLLNKSLYFSQYFFKVREGFDFMIAPHHRLMNMVLDKVFSGQIKRLIINVSPGYTKTESAVINFMAKGLAMNPKAKFIHLTYSSDLASENSQKCRDIIESPEFQALFPMKIRDDTNSKKKWYTEQGGGVYATASGQAVTGFRAGQPDKSQFTGAIIIDDPIKPEDVYSDTTRDKINNRFNNTIKSRLMHPDIPVIVIMQRLHPIDLSGYLLEGGSKDEWSHLFLPVLINEETMNFYPKSYTHGNKIPIKLPEGPLWDFKHTQEDIEQLKAADPFVFGAQYLQLPRLDGGTLYQERWMKLYQDLPNDISHSIITVDTASKTGTYNDYTVFQCWGISPSSGIYLIDQVRDKFTAPQLLTEFKLFYHKYAKSSLYRQFNLYEAVIEDTSAGTGLIQTLAELGYTNIKGVKPTKDKVYRSFAAIPYLAQGRVHFPAKAEFWDELKEEMLAFSVDDSHKHDDMVDAMLMAVENYLMDNLWIYGDMNEDQEIDDVDPVLPEQGAGFQALDVIREREARHAEREMTEDAYTPYGAFDPDAGLSSYDKCKKATQQYVDKAFNAAYNADAKRRY